MDKPSAQRSRTMAAVRRRDTGPERRVEQWLRDAGVACERDVPDLPGRPDFHIPQAKLVIFVHGCWRHGHACPRGARVPRTNRDYWLAKVARNRRRDRRVTAELRRKGYAVWTLWECRLKRDRLPGRLLSAIRQREARTNKPDEM